MPDEKNDGKFINELKLSPEQESMTKTLSSESELHRILIHLSGEHDYNTTGREIVPYLVTLDVGRDKKKYQTLIDHDGVLKITRQKVKTDADGEPVLDADGNEIQKDVTTEYIAEFCGASHSRNQKQLFVEKSIKDKLDDILLCGIPKDTVYPKPSKWNAYFALVTTDTEPVSYMPNIVVVDDFKKNITDMVDAVHVSGKGDTKKYGVIENQKRDVEILPFDGAGLVTPECAQKWADELRCRCRKTGEKYLPSCFQFRCLPALKGEVFVFDIYGFAREYGVSKITDVYGKEWDLFENRIDAILTKSQFKFWNLYPDMKSWRDEFEKPVHGYRRTFNIASYADAPEDLKETTLLSYQPLQTVSFTDEEIERLVKESVDLYKKIKSNADEFLQYRGLLHISEDGTRQYTVNDFTPPYYEALLYKKELLGDKYIREKITEDIKRLRNELLSGKQRVHGHYEVLAPDIYGLSEWAFGLSVKGLLSEPYQIYSDYWLRKGVSKVDIIRNPHIAMEHRIGTVITSELMQKWYKYQKATIVTGMYDTLAYALGTADFDGDTVGSLENQQVIQAVKRERDTGHGSLIYKDEPDAEKQKDAKKKENPGVLISDVAALMQVNQLAFQNNIGDIINKVTNLWSMIEPETEDEETRELNELLRSYIKIGVIVGEETIDFAKTGEKAEFPAEIKTFLKNKKKGYWMRYLEKCQFTAQKETAALKKIEMYGGELDDYKKFSDYDCNMNKLCHCAEKEIAAIDSEWDGQQSGDFNFSTLLKGIPHVSRLLQDKLKELQKEYQTVSERCRQAEQYVQDKSDRKNIAFRYCFFYEKCRTELLYLVPDIENLLDMLLLIYYDDKFFKDKSKDILWNAFPKEMIARCKGENTGEIDYEKVVKKHIQNVKYEKKNTRTKALSIRYFDNDKDTSKRVVMITTGDRKTINKLISADSDVPVKRKDNVSKLRRIFAVLLFLYRKNNLKQLEFKDNAPGDLTNTAIAILAGVNVSYVPVAFEWLQKMGLLGVEVRKSDGNLKVKVLFDYYAGDSWIVTSDYNEAGTKIRDCYR